jgi:hypothetical protein
MTAPSLFIKRLKAAALQAAGRAAAAKTQVRTAKAQLKQARKLFKIEKRAAKQARREADAAAKIARAPRPAATLELEPAVRKASRAKPPKTAAKTSPKKIRPPRAAKAPAAEAPDTMRSAAEVAKSVIERLHAPPPILPPAPAIPDPAGAPNKT